MTAWISDQSEEYEEDRNSNSNGIKYIDSFAFLSSSFATLADNLPKEDFIYMEKYLHDEITQQPYPNVPRNGGERLAELERERQKMFENKLCDSDISDEDYTHAQKVWQFFDVCQNIWQCDCYNSSIEETFSVYACFWKFFV